MKLMNKIFKKSFVSLFVLLALNFAAFSQNSIIQGQVTYGNVASTPLAGVTVTLEDLVGSVVTSTVSNSSGMYSFNIATSGTYTIKVSSNATAGGFNSTDALIVLKHFVNVSHLTGIYLSAANVDQIVHVNSLDAFYIQRRFSGIITTFPNGDWFFEQASQVVNTGESYTINLKGLCYGDVNGSYTPPTIQGNPCPNLPSFVYGGQTYNTLLIGVQCWMKENLNIGTFVSSSNTGSAHSDMSDNGIVEKYCQDNNPSNCAVYGALYEWNELMNYSTQNGAKGICPVGWHIPTDQEWCILSSTIDPSVNCTVSDWTGTDAGGKMKETGVQHWNLPNTGATNSSGFSVTGSGDRYPEGFFAGYKNYAVYWTSTTVSEYSNPYYRYFHTNNANIFRNNQSFKTNGFAARCIKDSCVYAPTQSNAGDDQLIYDDSTSLQANIPVYGIGTWSVLSGTDGLIDDIHNPLSAFTGSFDSTYVLVWQIATGCASTSDTVVIEFEYTGSPFACPEIPSLVYEGRIYNTVLIGTQCWMKENLNVGTMITGTSTPSLNGTIEKYCQNNDTAQCAVYGALYSWNEMMAYSTAPGSQGICPQGWHIPTDAEWCTLSTYLDPNVNCSSTSWSGPSVGAKLKESGFSHWSIPNTGATNESHFTALGSGDRYPSGAFSGLNSYAVFWTSTLGPVNPYYRYLKYDNSNILRNSQSFITNGFSARCIKDN